MEKDYPSFKELTPTDGRDLDEKIAAEHFFGKSIPESYEMFLSNPDYFLNDFLHLGKEGFLFYAEIIVLYLRECVDGYDDVFIDFFKYIVKSRGDDLRGTKLLSLIEDVLHEEI
ncbi:hypothetical protein [Roseibacillus ishigakijimensis]|uniref:Uncharacterized protein n=1 Tax=Roseibacillus ishigakijimensis TaxID=454146 RepID=A0A934RJ82_9BACT|nr:hypothetical protein [Roseibacillus ishigakijimensis]MBK1832424.1 hypothetical protein [Roseibacillus ishigakijimensis]